MDEINKETLDKLKTLLNSWLVFYQKAHTYHWNLQGPQFLEVHSYLQKLYEESAGHIDTIAERIRQMGIIIPVTLGGAAVDSVVSDINNAENLQEISADVIQSLEKLTGLQNEIMKEVENVGDYVTMDMITQLSKCTTFNLWFFRSLSEPIG